LPTIRELNEMMNRQAGRSADRGATGGPPPAVIRCERCGYDRSGLALDARCPECGYQRGRLSNAAIAVSIGDLERIRLHGAALSLSVVGTLLLGLAWPWVVAIGNKSATAAIITMLGLLALWAVAIFRITMPFGVVFQSSRAEPAILPPAPSPASPSSPPAAFWRSP
jgi:hypothetical protein